MGALLVLGACPVAGQVDAPKAEEIFQRVAQQVDKQPVELRHAGRELRRDPSAGCPELQAGWALELFAEGLGQAGSDLSECLAEVQQCSTTYTRLHWYAGFLLYRQGKFAEALVQMDRALGDDLVRAEALDARGGLHALLGDYGAAVTDFTALMNLDPEAAPFSVYVNLSGIQLVMGEWEEAIRWTEKGLEKVQKKRAEISHSSPEFAQLSEVEQALLSNQLASATRKGDATLAYATWRKMGLVDLEQTKLSNLESVLDFALTDDRFQIYEYIKEEGRQRWAKLSDRE
jgi:tetratricopeptide (TPR) repeat protein